MSNGLGSIGPKTDIFPISKHYNFIDLKLFVKGRMICVIMLQMMKIKKIKIYVKLAEKNVIYLVLEIAPAIL